MYQAHASQYKQQAALDEERMKLSASGLQDKTRTLVDPTKIAQVKQIIRDMGVDPDSQQGKAMVDPIATEEGWTSTYPVNEKGVMGANPIFGFGTQATGEAGAAKPGGKGGDETAHQNAAHYSEAHKLALEEAKLAGETTVSAEKIQEHLAAISGRTPGGQKEKAAKNYTETLAKADVSIQQTMEDNTLPPGLKETRVKTMSTIKQLMIQYPPGSRPKAIARKIEGLQKYYDQLASVKLGAPQQGEATPQPSAPPPEQRRSFVSDLGNVGRNVRGAIESTAPPLPAMPEQLKSFGQYLFGG